MISPLTYPYKLLTKAGLYAEQYGFTPSKLCARASREKRVILANSIPKAGTNMLVRLLYLLPPFYRALQRTITTADEAVHCLRKAKGGHILVAHLKYNEVLKHLLFQSDIRHLLMIRDPRAIAWSNIKYITQDRGHRLHSYYKEKLKNDEERLMATLNGIPGELLEDGVPSLALIEHVNGYLSWAEDDNCFLVRFEELVGTRGGGSDDIQRWTVESVTAFLGMPKNELLIERVCNRIYSTNSRTYRQGRIDHWRQEMPIHLQQICNDRLAGAIEALGYSL